MPRAFRDAEDIKAEIKRRGHTVSKLSEGLGFSPSALSQRWKRTRAWPVLDERLADFLGTTAHDLFPSHYDRDGRPKGIVRRQNVTRGFDPSLCPKLAKELAA